MPLANPFNPQDPRWTGKPMKKKPRVIKRVTSPSSRRRAGSIGVSSSSRQRTHRRGPGNR